MFKTLSSEDAARIAAIPLDYAWDTWIGNGFLAAFGDENPRIVNALEALDIQSA